ncbi:MAG TPA: hypothetical protein VNN06_18050, partial [Ramlibacter sp.]|nr:hypothetical protein [Ramlibacter sp.]
MQSCTTQTYYENRTVGYNVLYEYAGRQYNVQMPNDPGPTIRLQVSPMTDSGAAPEIAEAPAAPGAPGVIVAPPMTRAVGQPVAQVVAVPPAMYPAAYPAYPAYPAYYGSPYYYYPPIGLSLNFGFSSGHSHHRWR